jgi:hypothetical protein
MYFNEAEVVELGLAEELIQDEPDQVTLKALRIQPESNSRRPSMSPMPSKETGRLGCARSRPLSSAH